MNEQEKNDRRIQLWSECDEIVRQAEDEGRGLRASEARRFRAKEQEMRELSGETGADEHDDPVRRHRDRDKVDRSGLIDTSPGQIRSRSDSEEGQPLTRDQSYADYVRRFRAPAEEDWDLNFDRWLRGATTGQWDSASSRERRAQAEGTNSAGGFAVPMPLAAQLIDRARNASRIMAAGTRTVDMTSRTLDIARVAEDPDPVWHAENTQETQTEMTLDRVRLEAKTQFMLVRASREVVEDADGLTDALMRAFSAQIALGWDSAALYGSGGDAPVGLKNDGSVSQKELLATPTWDNYVTAVGNLADVNETANAVIHAPRTERALTTQKASGSGEYLRAPSYLDGLSRLQTNQVPTDLSASDSSTDNSDAFFGDFEQLVLGLRSDMVITPLTERYADYGQIAWVVWWRGDIAPRRSQAFHILTGLKA